MWQKQRKRWAFCTRRKDFAIAANPLAFAFSPHGSAAVDRRCKCDAEDQKCWPFITGARAAAGVPPNITIARDRFAILLI